MKPITVKELIEQLQAMPPDAFVHTEGCDCVGPCSGARVANQRNGETAGTVVLTRDDSRELGPDSSS